MTYDDTLTMQWVLEFKYELFQIGYSFTLIYPCILNYSSKFDLYTKSSKMPDIEKLRPYYQNLIDTYIPGVIKF